MLSAVECWWEVSKMDVYEAIRERRSVRSYKPDPIPEEVLNRLLEAMRLAPSGGNRQPWQFIVVRDASIKQQLVPACWNQQFIAQAPVVVVACGRYEDAVGVYNRGDETFVVDGTELRRQVESGNVDYYASCFAIDLSIALTHLMLAARAEGLGTCWIGAFHEGKVKSILGIPQDFRVVALMTVGYPTEWPGPRDRKPLSEIVRYDRYTQV